MILAPSVWRKPCNSSTSARSRARKQRWCGQTLAADCAPEPQGEGRVAAVVDGRSLRLEDGREVRLAGIERSGTDRASGRAALSAIAANREVTLHGEDDSPDRYGRQAAFVFVAGSEH